MVLFCIFDIGMQTISDIKVIPVDKTQLLSRINKLSPWGLSEIEKVISEIEHAAKIVEEIAIPKLKHQDIIERLLEKLKNDPTCKILHVKLSKHIREDWTTIKEKQLFSCFLTDSLQQFETISSESILHKRITRGSGSGSYFEDVFSLILDWYLSSQTPLWSKNSKFKWKIEINSPVIIPGNRNKKKPDIIISDEKTGKAHVVIELKKSFTKSSLKKTYNDEYTEYSKLGSQLKYMFIIFQSSKTKTKTYKQLQGCRVICNDYGLWGKSIAPKVVDSMESILEEIYSHLKLK